MPIVAIVGIDGCGKTTQAKMLADNLTKSGYSVVYLRPVFLFLGFLTRSENEGLLSAISPRKARTSSTTGKSKESLSAIRFLTGVLGYLHAFGVYLLMVYRSRKSTITVCDRYFFQFFFDLFGARADAVIDIFPKPDITFLIDGQIDLLYARMSNPFDASASRTYYSRVRELLERASEKYGFIRIDAGLDIHSIGKEVLSTVINTLEDASHE